MATSADIETVLTSYVAGLLYPEDGPAFVPSFCIARGWPTEADIRKAISQQAGLVGVYAMAETAKDITTTLRCWKTISPGMGVMEIGRMMQVFRLDIWAPTPQSRDAMLAVLMPGLKVKTRYALPDNSVATLMKLQVTGPDDRPSHADEWAQSLELTMQYPLLYTQAQPVVTDISPIMSVISSE